MGMRRYISLTLIGFCLSLLYPSPSKAVHKGAGDITCGSCHTMHSSQGGTNGPNMGGAAGSFILLRAGASSISSRAEIHKLCLQCHADNGSQASVSHQPQNVIAPKVYSSGSWSQNDPFNKIGAGGNFYGELDAGWSNTDGTATNPAMLGKGHTLFRSNVVPPGGDTTPITEFSCTNCHDPHGASSTADTNTNIFRNLKVIATGAGVNSGVKFYSDTTAERYLHKSYVGGVNPSGTSGYFGGTTCGDGTGGTVPCDNANQAIWPVYRGTLQGDPNTDSVNSNAYGTGLDIKASTDGTQAATMSRWCSQCHDNWHVIIVPGNKQKIIPKPPEYTVGDWNWKRHPVDSVVPRGASPGCATGCHPSRLDRINYSLQLIKDGKALPVTSGTDSANNAYYLPYAAPAASGTGMEDLTDDHKVFCLSCHFAHGGPYYDNLRWDYTSAVSSGSQSGNGIASNVGCQLCHNR